MMKWLMISCKKSTYLLSKKEENKLSWIEKITLGGHLAICGICRKFEQQTGFIIHHAKHVQEHAVLSVEAKEKMQSVLKD